MFRGTPCVQKPTLNTCTWYLYIRQIFLMKYRMQSMHLYCNIIIWLGGPGRPLLPYIPYSLEFTASHGNQLRCEGGGRCWNWMINRCLIVNLLVNHDINSNSNKAIYQTFMKTFQFIFLYIK